MGLLGFFKTSPQIMSDQAKEIMTSGHGYQIASAIEEERKDENSKTSTITIEGKKLIIEKIGSSSK